MVGSGKTFYLASPLGVLRVLHVNQQIQALTILQRRRPASFTHGDQTRETRRLRAQLERYFYNPNDNTPLNLNPQGTPFQRRVWRALQAIPAGEVLTYGELAQRLRSSARAVGNACRANPIPILIPCHRVVAKTGIGGYSGKTAGKQIQIKHWLLQHEGARIK